MSNAFFTLNDISQIIDIKNVFYVLLFLSRFYVFNVVFILRTFFLNFVLFFFVSNTCRPARQSIVTVVCVSACNCKPRNYL